MTTKPANLPLATDSREESRTHIFMAAALDSDMGSMPVHVRNMSSSGALMEAVVLPKPGTKVTLKRGSLAARGRIAWSNGRRAGISFDATIFVADWMSRVPPDHQRQVDRLMASVKQGHPHPAAPVDDNARGMLDVFAEFAVLKADLTALGNSLAADMIMVATHPEIQLLDISLQRIDRIVTMLKRK